MCEWLKGRRAATQRQDSQQDRQQQVQTSGFQWRQTAQRSPCLSGGFTCVGCKTFPFAFVSSPTDLHSQVQCPRRLISRPPLSVRVYTDS